MRMLPVQDEGTFFGLRYEWDALLAASRQDSPYLRHHRVRAWWETFGAGRRLAVLTCREEDGRLVGVLPAFVAKQGRLTRVRVLRLLGDVGTGSACLSPFADPVYERDVLRAFAEHVREPRGWDMIDFRAMDAAGAFCRLLGAEDGAVVDPVSELTSWIALPKDWAAYLGSLRGGDRRELCRSLRRAAAPGVELEAVTDRAGLERAVDDLARLQERRLRLRLDPSFTVSASQRAFMLRVMSGQLAEGRLRLVFARYAGRRVAGLYQFRYGDRLYAERAGFETVEGLHDVMRPLYGIQIRAAIEEGCTAYDLSLGQQRYKAEWGDLRLRPLARVRVYAPSLAGQVRRNRDSMVDRTAV